MRASEYIRKIQDLVTTHGDLECVDAEDESMGEPEFSNDLDEPVIVLADKA